MTRRRSCNIIPVNVLIRVSMEVTPINRQSYMAEVANLLALITDDDTRERLIAQMEQMFDSAEDEAKLIEQIGSPTKVAVALIRYADKKRGTSPAQVAEAISSEPVTEMMEEAAANAEAPEAGEMPELAFAEASDYEDEPSEPVEDDMLPLEDAAVPERLEGVFADEEAFSDAAEPELAEASFEEAEAAVFEPVSEETAEEDFFAEVTAAAEEDEGGFTEMSEPEFEAAPAELEDVTDEFAQEDTEPAAPVDEALVQAVAAEAAEAFGEFPAEDDAFFQDVSAELPEQEEDPAMELAEELFGDAKPIPSSASGKESRPVDAEPEIEVIKTGWKAFLYFLIPGLVPGLPVFLVLLALSLVFLAIGVAAIACAVAVFMSAFIGFSVVADMLLLIGAGAALFAVAMVLMWFAIWFLVQVCFGWVRLIHRGGIRFSRKEVVVG